MSKLFLHPALLVFLGGGIGSVLRYVVGRGLAPVATFPLAILLVNVAASALLGWVAATFSAGRLPDDVRLALGVGLCGGLSTFSSFSQDTLALLQAGRTGAALFNVALNVAGCLAASAAGWALGR